MSNVDGPAHYGGKDNPYEAIKVMLAWHGPEATAWFCQLSAEKYLCRTEKKNAHVEDLRKAAWYAKAAADLREFGGLRA
jgi:hypothetical protein